MSMMQVFLNTESRNDFWEFDTPLRIDGTTYKSAANAFDGYVYNTAGWYHEGNTYFAWRQNNVNLDKNLLVGKFDGINVTVTEVSTPTQTLNYHNHPFAIVDKDGYVVVHHPIHNGEVPIYKSTLPESIASFNKISNNLGVGRIFAYPQMHQLPDGTWLLIGRRILSEVAPVTYILNVALSTDLITWTTYDLTEIAQENGSSEARHYPVQGNNQISGGYLHYYFTKRIVIGPFHHIRLYFIKTPTDSNFGKVWYNGTETFSKDISTLGAITEAELNANCLLVFDDTYSTVYINLFTGTSLNGNGLISINDVDVLGQKTYEVNTEIDTPSVNQYLFSHNEKVLMHLNKQQIYKVSADYQSIELISNTRELNKGTDSETELKIPRNINSVPTGSYTCGLTSVGQNLDNQTSTEYNDIIVSPIKKVR